MDDRVERVEFPLAGLPPELDGLSVAIISDVHAAPPPRGPEAHRRLVEAVNAAQPELMVLLGDLAHHFRDEWESLPAFAALKSPLGVFACLGNHEYGVMWYSRWFPPKGVPPARDWRRLYAEAGIRLLLNEAVQMERNAAPFWLLGVDDAYSAHDDLPAALAQATGPGFRLAITHSPDVMDNPRIEEVDLLLAGHTHGGQIRLPGIGAIWAPVRHARTRAAGRLRAGRTAVYVTRGAGEHLPVRILCPRELPVLVLRRVA